MKPDPIVLASASPRRRELLEQLGVPFEVHVSGLEEQPWPGEKPANYALRNSSDKARAVAALRPGRVVLAADTIVVQGDHILEKPVDAAHAFEMLKRLSGAEHEVITGICLLKGAREIGDAVITRVWFRAMTDGEIRSYVATGEPMDKAGAYGIQGGAAAFVDRIEGSYTNVVGLPTERLGLWLELLGVRSSPPADR